MPENNQILSVEGQLIGMPTAGPESFSQQQLDYLKRALGVDETVLWSGTGLFSSPSTVTISETVENFEYVKFEGYISEVTNETVICFGKPNTSATTGISYTRHSNTSGVVTYSDNLTCTASTLTVASHKHIWFNNGALQSGNAGIVITKIVGIHRIAGGN